MSDLEEVSDSELNEKIDDVSDTIKLLKKNIDEDEAESEVESEEGEDAGEDAGEGAGEGEDTGEGEVEEGEEQSEKEDEDEETIMTKKPTTLLPIDISDDEEDEDEEEDYLQKFDKNIRADFITTHHPESKNHNYEEIKALSRVSRNSSGIVSDVLHKTLPFLTKYEMTRVLGQRARQINSGAKTFVVVPPNIIDGYLIAKMELEQKKMPFIIKRPLPNRGFEYWNVSDLELI